MLQIIMIILAVMGLCEVITLKCLSIGVLTCIALQIILSTKITIKY